MRQLNKKWGFICERRAAISTSASLLLNSAFIRSSFRICQVRKQVSNNTLGLALSLRNALDADVREPSPGPAAFIPHDFPMAGRSLYAEMNYRF